jgi:hypothetical protein
MLPFLCDQSTGGKCVDEAHVLSKVSARARTTEFQALTAKPKKKTSASMPASAK